MSDLARRPTWWNEQLPELAGRREPMPAVERWQTGYVRYHRAGEAHVAQGGWTVPTSRQNIEMLARSGLEPMLPDVDTPQAALYSTMAPEAATIRIVEAPASFALPVKQDRRFSPSFRIRVDVHFRERVQLPLTVRAFVVSQHEKDTILSWQPPGEAPEMKPVTELKGTTSITHHFEACADPSSSQSGYHGVSRPSNHSSTSHTGRGHLHDSLLGGGHTNHLLDHSGQSGGHHQSRTSNLHSGLSHHHNGGGGGLSGYPGLPSVGGWDGSPSLHDNGGGGGNTNFVDHMVSLGMMMPSSAGGGGDGGYGMNPASYMQQGLGMQGMPPQQQQQQHNPHLISNLYNNGGGGGGLRGSMGHGNNGGGGAGTSLFATAFDPMMPEMKYEMHDGGGRGGWGDHGGGGGGGSSGGMQHHHGQPAQLSTASHDFDFESLEFLKPSRLKRVYLLFACSVMDLDTIFVVYNVPTVSICRAEQREKACTKLGLPANAHVAVQRVITAMAAYDPALATNSGPAAGSGMPVSVAAAMGVAAAAASAAAAAAAAHASAPVSGHSTPLMLGSPRGAGGGGGGGVAGMRAQLLVDPDNLGPLGSLDMDALDACVLDANALDGMFDSPMETPLQSAQRLHMAGAKRESSMPELEDLIPSAWGADLGLFDLGAKLHRSNVAPPPPADAGVGTSSFAWANENRSSAVAAGGGGGGAGSGGGSGKSGAEHRAGGSGGGGGGVEAPPHTGVPVSRLALREWILEEYDNTGLGRKLTQQDLSALLSQAGFPSDVSSEHATISQAQSDEFASQLRTVFAMLRQISSVWNLEDPVVISGFDMDRVGTVQALRLEPVGTFLCRFSMSQPGCLVLSCRVAAGHPRADADALLHAIIKLDDLQERRVDAWIRDFVGATHLLDVYRQRRVDKRKVFASNYTRLRPNIPLGTSSDLDITGGHLPEYDSAMAGAHSASSSHGLAHAFSGN